MLGPLSVVQPNETDTPERPALASQMNHEQSRFKSSARPMLDPEKVDNTDVNADVNTDLPENSAPMMNLRLEILAIGCAAVSAGCSYPGSSSHGGNIRSTAGEFAGPCAGPGQWICERSTSSEPVGTGGSRCE